MYGISKQNICLSFVFMDIKLCLIFFWFKSFIVKLPTILFQRYVTDKMEPDKVEKVQGQVDELKGIMVKNIGK